MQVCYLSSERDYTRPKLSSAMQYTAAVHEASVKISLRRTWDAMYRTQRDLRMFDELVIT